MGERLSTQLFRLTSVKPGTFEHRLFQQSTNQALDEAVARVVPKPGERGAAARMFGQSNSTERKS
jgi:hypothetical protein